MDDSTKGSIKSFEQSTQNFRCPITHLIMTYPVDNISCHTYEREAIEKWLETNSTDPLTMVKLSDKSIRFNKSLKTIIDDFVMKNIHLIAENEIYFSKKIHEQIKYFIMEKNDTEIKQILSNLIDYRYIINIFDDKSNYSAFYLSIESGSLEISKLIFDYLFDRDLLAKLDQAPSNLKPIYLNDLINLYKKCDCENKVNYLEENFRSLIVKKDPFDLTRKLLLMKGTSKIKDFIFNHNSILKLNANDGLILQAAINNNEDLFEVLSLRQCVNKADLKGLNCFYYAIKNQNLKILNLIMQIREYSSLIFSPLKVAVELYPNNFYLFDKIIELDPSYLNMTDAKNRTVLFYACNKSDLNLVTFLVNKPEILLNRLDVNLENCLHFAVRNGNRDIISILVKYGVYINQKNNKSKSPFDLAGKRIKQFILLELQRTIISNQKEMNSLKSTISNLNRDIKLNRTLEKIRNNDIYIVALGDEKGKIKLINMNTKEVCVNFEAHNGKVNDLNFGSDGCLFSCSADCTIKQWDLENASCVKTLYDTANNNPYLIEIFNDNILISVGKDKMVKKWDLTNLTCVVSLSGHTGRINCMKKIKNWIITSSEDRTIRIWDISNERCEKILQGHENSVNFVHLIDNNTLFSASSDLIFKLWDLNSFYNTCSYRISTDKFDFGIRLKNMEMIDSNCIIFSNGLNIFKLRLESKKLLGPLNAHSGDLIHLKCFDDGKKLLSVSSNKQINLWTLDSFELIETIQIHDDSSVIHSVRLMPNFSN